MASNAELNEQSNASAARFGAAAASAGLIVCAVGALGLVTSSSEAMISAGFDRAFANLSVPARTSVPAASDKSEDEWLRVSDANPDLIRTASVGQELRLTGAGAEHRLKITDVADLGEASTYIDTSSKPAHVLLITCREGDDATGIEYRIRLEGSFIRSIAVSEKARAL